MKSLSFFANSGAHDYELGEIQVDYAASTILLHLKNTAGESCTVCIENFKSVSITHTEKWGAGKYIYASELKRDAATGNVTLELLLNSGDEVVIVFTPKKELNFYEN